MTHLIDYQGEDRAPGWLLRAMQDKYLEDIGAVDVDSSIDASVRAAQASVLIDHLYPFGCDVAGISYRFVAGVWRDVERKFAEPRR